MEDLRGHEGWKWYGYPGHHICSRRCAYHLSTRVGDYLVSTVGAFFPRHDSTEMEPLGAGGKDSLFETMVFRCTGETEGDPDVDFSCIDMQRYPDSRDAERGHYETCWRYHKAA